MYSNNIVNFQESRTILNACIKNSGNLLIAPRIYIYIRIYFINSNFYILIKYSTARHVTSIHTYDENKIDRS